MPAQSIRMSTYFAGIISSDIMYWENNDNERVQCSGMSCGISQCGVNVFILLSYFGMWLTTTMAPLGVHSNISFRKK